MKHPFALLSTLCLAGCQTLSYKEPIDGERARVRLASQSSNVVVVRSYDDATCEVNEQEWMRLRSGFLVNNSPKRLGLPLWHFHENGAKEVFVDASHPFRALFIGEELAPSGSTITTYRCGVPVSFEFQSDLAYEVEYLWDRQSCSVVISQIESNGSPALRRLTQFDSRLSEMNAKCLGAFKKKRLF